MPLGTCSILSLSSFSFTSASTTSAIESKSWPLSCTACAIKSMAYTPFLRSESSTISNSIDGPFSLIWNASDVFTRTFGGRRWPWARRFRWSSWLIWRWFSWWRSCFRTWSSNRTPLRNQFGTRFAGPWPPAWPWTGRCSFSFWPQPTRPFNR